jgi:hypothetical protein
MNRIPVLLLIAYITMVSACERPQQAVNRKNAEALAEMHEAAPELRGKAIEKFRAEGLIVAVTVVEGDTAEVEVTDAFESLPLKSQESICIVVFSHCFGSSVGADPNRKLLLRAVSTREVIKKYRPSFGLTGP